MLCNVKDRGLYQKRWAPKNGLDCKKMEKVDNPHVISHDLRTPDYTAAKQVPTKPPVATFHQCLK